MNKSSRWNTLRALAVVPVIALALLAFANPKSVAAVVTASVQQDNAVQSEMQSPEPVQVEAVPQPVEVEAEEQPVEENPVEPVPESKNVYESVEQMPEFPGGMEEMMKFLQQNIQYPASAAKNKVEGRVVLQFVVEKDGQIGEVKVARSVDPELDAEALRVVKSMPNFIPGRQDGKPVAVWYTIPISFKLQGKPQPQDPK